LNGYVRMWGGVSGTCGRVELLA